MSHVQNYLAIKTFIRLRSLGQGQGRGLRGVLLRTVQLPDLPQTSHGGLRQDDLQDLLWWEGGARHPHRASHREGCHQIRSVSSRWDVGSRLNYVIPRDNLVEVGIFFRDPFYVMIEREMRITELDFVSNIGGLMGLLMGFSFISLIELLYHVCLTLLNIFKRK